MFDKFLFVLEKDKFLSFVVFLIRKLSSETDVKVRDYCYFGLS